MTDALTPELLNQIEEHLQQNKRLGGIPLSPPEPSPDSFAGKILAAQRRKAADAKRLGEERNAQMAAAREADRQEARRELNAKSRDIEKFNSDLEKLRTDIRALRDQFSRRWPHDFGAQIEALRKRTQ